MHKLSVSIGILAASMMAVAQTAPTAPPTPSANPTEGRVVDQAYINSFIGFSYPLPEGFYDNTGESLASHAGESPNGIFYLLVADRSTTGRSRNRVLLVAEDARHYQPGFAVKDYVAKMAGALSGHGLAASAELSPVQFGSQEFYRTDFHQDANGVVLYKAFVATLVHGYFLSWTFTTTSQPQVDELVDSLQKLTFATGEAVPPGANPAAVPPAASPAQLPTSEHPKRVRVSEKVSQTLLIKSVNPRYPAGALSARIQGSVILQAIISREGDVTEVKLVSGHPMLVPSAIDAVKRWKYKPYLLNGEPVEVETQVTVNYELYR